MRRVVTTQYPFKIPDRLASRLPPPAANGLVYTDVRFHSTWDGILVINQQMECIGVFAGRRVIQYPLPFTPEEIEDFRPPSLRNRLMTFWPTWLDVMSASMIAIWVVSPLLILAAGGGFPAFLLLLAGVMNLCSILLMYSIPGFPFLRLPTAAMGFTQIVFCCMHLLIYALRYLHHHRGA